MSIAFERVTSNNNNNNTIQRSTAHFIHGGGHGLSVCNRSMGSNDLTASMIVKVENQRVDDDDDDDECSDSDDSSIGRNSDLSSVSSVDGDDDEQDIGEIEVQSVLKGPLDTMDDLHDVLPIRKGISMHYSGKSKSFTSLADAVSSSSIKEIAKPTNPYTKKRKNELLNGIKNHNPKLPPRVSSDGGIFKRMTNGNCSSITSLGSSNLNTDSSSPPIYLPPRHPPTKISPANEQMKSCLPTRQNNLSFRSYSVSDLHNFACETPCFTGLVIDNRLP